MVVQIVLLSKSTYCLGDWDMQYVVETSGSVYNRKSWDKLVKGHVHGSGHAHLSKCCFSAGACCVVYARNMIIIHNVVREPFCTLPWQSLALDQLKYLQIAVKLINQTWKKT